MRIALVHNHYSKTHLKKVVGEMLELGAPTIKVLDLEFDGMVQALEGCHRLRACEILGITPNLEWVEGSDIITTDDGEFEACEIGDYENYQITIECDKIVGKEV